MPRVWGAWSATSATGARYRVAVDYTISGTTITYTYFFESAFSIYKNVTLTRTGAISGVYTPRVDTAGGVVALGYGGSISGARGSSVTIGGRVTNILHGLTCSVSVSIPIPAVAPSKPSRPTISNVSASGLRGNLASAPANGGASINAYGWQCEGGPSETLTSGGRTWNVTGLSADTSYRVRVRARNSVGWGPWSDWSTAARTSPLAPNAPTGLTVSRNSDTSQALSWTRNVASGRPYASQRIQRRHSGPGIAPTAWATIVNNLPATATSFTDTSTVAARRYDYRVVAVNAGGTGASSHASINTAPSAPSSVVATRDGNNIRLAITLTATYAGVGQMVIRHRADGGAWAVLATVTAANTYTHVAPNPAQTHQYQVASRTNLGNALTGPYSAPSNTVQLQAPPLAPTNLAPSGTVVDASGAVRLSWRHNPVDTSPQSARQIRYRVAGATSWTTLAAVTSTTQYQDVTAFSNGNSYEWQVRTRGDDPGYSPWSTTATFTASSAPKVAIIAPTWVVETSSATASWSYYDAEGTAQSRAEVNLTSDGESVEFRTVNGSASTLPLNTALINGREYTLRVRVRDGSGLWSEWDSSTFTVNFAAPPAPTLAVEWDRERGAAILSIDNPTDLATYEWEGTPGQSASVRKVNGIPVAYNLVHNPSFEHGTTGWATSGGTLTRTAAYPQMWRDSFDGRAGSWIGQLTSDGSSFQTYIISPSVELAPLGNPKFVAARGLIANDAHTPILQGRLVIQFHDETQTNIGQYPPGHNGYRGAYQPAGIEETHVAPVPEGTVTTRVVPWIRTSDETTIISAGSRAWFDKMMIGVGDSESEALAAVAEYFDGDTQSQVLATSNDILRRVDGGEWVIIATGVPINATIIDPTPPLKGLVEYKARAWSDLPSSTDGAEAELVIPRGLLPTYLNTGPGFSEVVALWDNTRLSKNNERAKTRHKRAGRAHPITKWGQHRDHTSTLTATINRNSPGATIDDVFALEDTPHVACYRDALGHKEFVTIDNVSADVERDGRWSLSITMTREDYTEGIQQ